MFASSDFTALGRSRDYALRRAREEASRRATVALLLPQGRPSAWLLLLVGSCTYVIVHTVLLRLS